MCILINKVKIIGSLHVAFRRAFCTMVLHYYCVFPCGYLYGIIVLPYFLLYDFRAVYNIMCKHRVRCSVLLVLSVALHTLIC